jgi:hypothetical protein
MDKKDLKIKYNNDFTIVRDLFNSFDPCGLIQGGAPIDEYDCLTTQILSGLYQIKSKQELANLIITELDHHFGTIDKSKISDNFKFEMDRFIDEIKTKISPAANNGSQPMRVSEG